MWYAFYCEDIENSLPLRAPVRPAHLERVQKLLDEGRLLVAGPFPAIDSNDPGVAGFSGSLIVAEFDSLAAAQSWAKEDPYALAGVYKNVEIKPFKKVLP